MFYTKPVPLDKSKHQNLKLKSKRNFSFAGQTNSVPLGATEFFNCSRHHPVMFVKNKAEEYIPIALLSLAAKGHELGDDWQDVYVPFYVRRYPFFVESSKQAVVIDEECTDLQEEEGEPLFTEAGEPTEILTKVIEFLDMTDRSYRQTEEYCKALKEKDLLVPFKGTVKFSNTEMKLDHMYVVDEVKMHKSLTDEEIVQWYKKGWITWTIAHLHSVSSIDQVIKRLKAAAAAKESAKKA